MIRRLLLLLFWLLELAAMAAGALLLALWIWSGSEGSLALAIRQAGDYLPAGQTLVAQDVRGSVRSGGSIGSLRWESQGLTVQARQISFAWQPLDLLLRRLRLTSLQLAEVDIQDDRPASEPSAPGEMLLPLRIDLPFAVDLLRMHGATTFAARSLSGRYRFMDEHHRLTLSSIQVADGRYNASVDLHGRQPLALDMQLQGAVQAPIGDGRNLVLEASATLRGALAGNNPALDLAVQLQPASGNPGAPAPAAGMRASVSGQISPWAKQPVVAAQADFNQLDLAALWPTAPKTLLTGNARVRPHGANWLAQLNLINRNAGPWDQGRVPVNSVKALVDLGPGRWNIQSLHAEAGGGRIKLQGKVADPATLGATQGWQGQVEIQMVDPSLLHSQMQPARLDGELQARAEQGAIVFEAALRPSAEQGRKSALRGLRLREGTAKGRWADGWLRVKDLQLRTDDASLVGQLDLQPQSQTANGQLRLTLPGADVRLSGKFGARDGDARLVLALTDAQRSARWIGRLPQAPRSLAGLALQGRANLDLRWTGGWESLLHGGAAEPTLQATLQIPRMAYQASGQDAAQQLQIRDFNAQLSGALSALTLKADGALQLAARRAQFQTHALGGRGRNGDWSATVDTLRLQAQDPQIPGPWNLVLQQPLALALTRTTTDTSVRVGAAQAELSGPAAGVATLAWQPLSWRSGAGAALGSRGALRAIPMTWLSLIGNAQLDTIGLSGDMIFDADWDLTLGDTLKLRAAVVRRSGDIRVQTDGTGSAGARLQSTAGTFVQAGVRDARIAVEADGAQLHASARWDSERAGNAQAEFSTRVSRAGDGWEWASDSPLQASIKANMPQVGVWSILAPPGWRMRGTVDADLQLAGTRQDPRWSGTLQGDDLALRSVVNGIEFGQGRLRAALHGRRLDIDAFSLQGAGGAAGGELTATGYAVWAPQGSDTGLAGIELQLDASAKALRLSARADRRLSVSGDVHARLDQARLGVRGALTVDQALFILPDESAPSLGGDVVVRRAGAEPSRDSTPSLASTKPAASASAARIAADVRVSLDLGRDFRVRGRGIDTKVAGELQLRTSLQAGEAPQLTGELRTTDGRFQAYGQDLTIERGVLRFSGPYDNPSLNILALRPQLTQRVGVQITGTALSPRIRLYAEPDMPEAEKLAWLVLGRSATSGGAEAAVLQQAAMALLGGRDQSGGIAGRLGLDELSVSGATDTASGGASAATVTLGKRISKDFYVAYERSLAGTLGTFSIFYDLSRRFTLRARTGEQSAIDLIYTLSYD